MNQHKIQNATRFIGKNAVFVNANIFADKSGVISKYICMEKAERKGKKK